MKLIIDIDENVYNACNEYKDNVLLGILQRILYTAISNGTPLSEELEKIREKFQKHLKESIKDSLDYTVGIAKGIEIIDNHISELKGENDENTL